jgi:hypothetical protein
MPKAKRKAVSKGKFAAEDTTVDETIVAASPKSRSKRSSGSKSGTSLGDDAALITVEIPHTSTKPVFFFWTDEDSEGGFLSPWFTSPFEYGGTRYVSAGQYITACRARDYNDLVRKFGMHH